MDRVSDFFSGLHGELRHNGHTCLAYHTPSRISAIIKLTNACNSRCIYCQSWRDKPIQTLPIECLGNVVHDIQKFKRYRVILSGGEPTLSNELPNAVSLMAKNNIPTVVITNGLALSTDAQWIREIDELTFSIDTLCYDTYIHLRGVNGLERVVGNLANAITLSREFGGHPLVSVNIVLTKQALKELRQTVVRLVQIGVKRLYFMQLETHTGFGDGLSPSSSDWDAFWSLDYQEIIDMLSAIGVSIPRWPFHPQGILATKPRGPCLVPWLQAVIRPNGDVYPCCRLGDDGSEDCRDLRYRLGNLKENNFGTIIQGERGRTVRHDLLKSSPQPCVNCDLGLICSYEYMVGNELEKTESKPKQTLAYPEYIKV